MPLVLQVLWPFPLWGLTLTFISFARVQLSFFHARCLLWVGEKKSLVFFLKFQPKQLDSKNKASEKYAVLLVWEYSGVLLWCSSAPKLWSKDLKFGISSAFVLRMCLLPPCKNPPRFPDRFTRLWKIAMLHGLNRNFLKLHSKFPLDSVHTGNASGRVEPHISSCFW